MPHAANGFAAARPPLAHSLPSIDWIALCASPRSGGSVTLEALLHTFARAEPIEGSVVSGAAVLSPAAARTVWVPPSSRVARKTPPPTSARRLNAPVASSRRDRDGRGTGAGRPRS